MLGGAALEEMRLTDAAGGLLASPVTRSSRVPADAGHRAGRGRRRSDVAVAEPTCVARVVSHRAGPSPTSPAASSPRGSWSAPAAAPAAPTGSTDLLELTELLGGALGVSRVVTSLGWRPHHEQVGQTGSRISPDLYIACGISGAIQHWAGCSSSKTILAINTDADAPMVTKAHYAVIGDLHEVVPAINEEIKARRGG